MSRLLSLRPWRLIGIMAAAAFALSAESLALRSSGASVAGTAFWVAAGPTAVVAGGSTSAGRAAAAAPPRRPRSSSSFPGRARAVGLPRGGGVGAAAAGATTTTIDEFRLPLRRRRALSSSDGRDGDDDEPFALSEAGTTTASLVEAARRAVDDGVSAAVDDEAVDDDAGAGVRSAAEDVARRFLSASCPAFLASPASSDADRLVKIGRSLSDLVSSVRKDDGAKEEEEALLESSLRLLVEECDVLASGNITVPTVRFGHTGLDMPIVSLGCMRFQQAWGPNITSMDDVTDECQRNLVGILRRAIELGITHIETARGYGCSELQLGEALRELFESEEVRREDLIIQTKCPTKSTAAEFREVLEKSFANLGLDYVDLFSFHGVNMDEQFDLIFDNGDDGGSLMDVVREYVAAGKIRHVGFSTHASPSLIRRLVETDAFDYVNLHYHWLGSYTASGDGGSGNLEIVRLLQRRDMGVFVISVNDKGGRLYAPSRKLRSLTLPDMEPMTFGSTWLWSHFTIDGEGAPVHTVSVGAARPSDLDQPAVAAHRFGTRQADTAERLGRVLRRLGRAQEEALGREWTEDWHATSLPNWTESGDAVPHGFVVWLHNVVKSFGMLDFARDRYGPLVSHREAWDDGLSKEENIDAIGRIRWGWTPGCAVRMGADYQDDLIGIPEEKRAAIREAEEFVHRWCARRDEGRESGDKSAPPAEKPPRDWETAYDMRPWTAFPERRSI